MHRCDTGLFTPLFTPQAARATLEELPASTTAVPPSERERRHSLLAAVHARAVALGEGGLRAALLRLWRGGAAGAADAAEAGGAPDELSAEAVGAR